MAGPRLGHNAEHGGVLQCARLLLCAAGAGDAATPPAVRHLGGRELRQGRVGPLGQDCLRGSPTATQSHHPAPTWAANAHARIGPFRPEEPEFVRPGSLLTMPQLPNCPTAPASLQ